MFFSWIHFISLSDLAEYIFWIIGPNVARDSWNFERWQIYFHVFKSTCSKRPMTLNHIFNACHLLQCVYILSIVSKEFSAGLNTANELVTWGWWRLQNQKLIWLHSFWSFPILTSIKVDKVKNLAEWSQISFPLYLWKELIDFLF